MFTGVMRVYECLCLTYPLQNRCHSQMLTSLNLADLKTKGKVSPTKVEYQVG